MASVFLSYDHDDIARAAPLAAALEAHGHSVWWDRSIHGGAEYNSEIESAVERSDAVVVLWSDRSVRSAWVRDEAAEGRDRGKLVPVLIEPIKPPMGFRQYQTLDLASWTGGKRIPRLSELLLAIDTVAGKNSTFSLSPVPMARPQPVPPAPRNFASHSPARPALSRRMLVGGSAAAAAATLTGGGIWWSVRHRVDPRFKAFVDQAEDAVRHQTADRQTIRTLEQAVAIQPDNAKALGLLALVKSMVAQSEDPGLVTDAERTARQALAIDPREPNALLAMFELQGSSLDWFTRDQKLRQILSLDRNNLTAISELVVLTQATGLSHESWDLNERALALEPLSADFLGRRALKLWIFGRQSEADKVSDQLRALYPKNEWSFFARFMIYAFTGRARAAQAMLDGEPTGGRAPFAQLWHASLPALDQPSPASIARAREAAIKAAKISLPLASQAVWIVSALHDVDTAFDIANGLLFGKGPIVPREQPGANNAATSASWRISTQWMWLPPSAAMRPDRRFLSLCEQVGLTDYWRKRGVRPDGLRF